MLAGLLKAFPPLVGARFSFRVVHRYTGGGICRSSIQLNFEQRNQFHSDVAYGPGFEEGLEKAVGLLEYEETFNKATWVSLGRRA